VTAIPAGASSGIELSNLSAELTGAEAPGRQQQCRATLLVLAALARDAKSSFRARSSSRWRFVPAARRDGASRARRVRSATHQPNAPQDYRNAITDKTARYARA